MAHQQSRSDHYTSIRKMREHKRTRRGREKRERLEKYKRKLAEKHEYLGAFSYFWDGPGLYDCYLIEDIPPYRLARCVYRNRTGHDSWVKDKRGWAVLKLREPVQEYEPPEDGLAGPFHDVSATDCPEPMVSMYTTSQKDARKRIQQKINDARVKEIDKQRVGPRVEAMKEIIKAGYRQISKRVHPDHGGSEEEMVRLNDAKKHLQMMIEDAESWIDIPRWVRSAASWFDDPISHVKDRRN